MLDNSKNIPQKSKKQSLTDYTEILTDWYITNTSPQYRKQRGQFFTPKKISEFMVKQFTKIDEIENIKILDPGAGIGMFASVICEHFLSRKKLINITFDLYENDERLLPLLKANMNNCKKKLISDGIKISYKILKKDFILSNASIFNDKGFLSNKKRYDFIISNPPYYKINKSSPQATAMSKIVKGQPNIYTLFMALSAKLLKDGGQMIMLTPRSYCSGLYFKKFRRWFFHQMRPIKIHVFDSRKEIFKKYNVLQEILLLTAVKSLNKPKKVIISMSHRVFDDKNSLTVRKAAYNNVIIENDDDFNVRIPESNVDECVANEFKKFKFNIKSLGFKASTGPVVPFRTLPYLSKTVRGNSCNPLIRMQNIRDGQIVWPINLKNKHIAVKNRENSHKLLIPKGNYVLLKRFSTKEGRRRIDAGVLLKNRFQTEYIGIENHVNFIFKKDGLMTSDEVYGISTLLNSKLYNKFFQMSNGCTQVNVSEIENLPFPSRENITLIGRNAKKEIGFNEYRNEYIVARALNINGRIVNKLLNY